MTESWNGVGVFEGREGEGRSCFSCAGGVDDEFLFVPALVEVAEAVVFESGGAALGAVDLEVSAAGNVEAERLGEFVGFGFWDGFMHGWSPSGRWSFVVDRRRVQPLAVGL